jgi:tRNA1Val (adenine37-N6)-methyltransferase
LMIAGANPAAVVTAVEVQDVSYRLLARNVEENGLTERIVPVRADLREVDLGMRRFELVTGSPPYVRPGAGVTPRDPQRAGARFELRGGIEAYCRAAARWLSVDGRAVFLMDGAQDDRSRRAADEAGLFVEERLTVRPRAGAAPRFIVYRMARANGEHESRESSLTIRDQNGEWTESFVAVRCALDLPPRDGSTG